MEVVRDERNDSAGDLTSRFEDKRLVRERVEEKIEKVFCPITCSFLSYRQTNQKFSIPSDPPCDSPRAVHASTSKV